MYRLQNGYVRRAAALPLALMHLGEQNNGSVAPPRARLHLNTVPLIAEPPKTTPKINHFRVLLQLQVKYVSGRQHRAIILCLMDPPIYSMSFFLWGRSRFAAYRF
jgi:hypothetical protein